MKHGNLGKSQSDGKRGGRRKCVWVAMVLIAIAFAGCTEKPQDGVTLDNFPKLFEKDAIIVVGENASSIELDAAKAVAYNLGDISVTRTDSKITGEEKSAYNLILIGRPDTKKMLRDVYERTNATEVTSESPGAGKGVLEILRNPWNESKVLILVQGSDEWGVRAGSVVLEEKQKVKVKAKVVVDWEEDAGVKLPIDNAEEAIKYANMDVNAQRFIKKWSSMGNKVNVDATFSNSSNNWDVKYRAITNIEENWFKIVINSNGTIIDKGGFL